MASAPLDQDFELPAGDERRLESSPVKIRFVQVVEDSRCPTDVTCVWAGNAKVRVEVDSAGAVLEGNLNTTLEPHRVTAFGHTFELRSVRPERRSDRLVQPSDYVVVLRATRAS